MTLSLPFRSRPTSSGSCGPKRPRWRRRWTICKSRLPRFSLEQLILLRQHQALPQHPQVWRERNGVFNRLAGVIVEDGFLERLQQLPHFIEQEAAFKIVRRVAGALVAARKDAGLIHAI